MRYLAVDLGDRRTGLALGDDETGLVSPLSVLEVSLGQRFGADLLDAIARALDQQIGERSPGEIVLGLPVNMDGTEGSRARIVRSFGARLGARTHREIRYQDERLTSADADWTMARSGLTRGQKKERRDAIAAAAILRDYLAGSKRSGVGDRQPGNVEDLPLDGLPPTPDA